VTTPRAAGHVTLLLPCARQQAIDWLEKRGTPVVVGEQTARGTVVRTVVDANWLPDGSDIVVVAHEASVELSGVVVIAVSWLRGGFPLVVRQGEGEAAVDLEDGEPPEGAEVAELCRLLGRDDLVLDAQAAVLTVYDDEIEYVGALHARRQLAQLLDLPCEFTGVTPAGTHQVVISRPDQALLLPAVAAGAKSPVWSLVLGDRLLLQMDDETAPTALAAVAFGTSRTPALLLERSREHFSLNVFRKGTELALRWPHEAVALGITPQVIRDFAVTDLVDRLGVDRDGAATRIADALGLQASAAAALRALAFRRDLLPDEVAAHLVALLWLPPETTDLLQARVRLSSHPDGVRIQPAPLRKAVVQVAAQGSGPDWWFSTWFAALYVLIATSAVVAAMSGWVSGGLRTFVLIGWSLNLAVYLVLFVARRRQRPLDHLERVR